MKKNLIIYESYYGTAKRTAEMYSLILSNSKVYEAKNAPKNIDCYDNIILVFAFHGYRTAENIKEYLKDNNETIKKKFIVIIGVGLSKMDLKNYCKPLYDIIGRTADITDFIQGELRVNKLTEIDKSILEKFLKKQNIKLMDMGVFKIEDVCNSAKGYKDIINKAFNALENKKLRKSIDDFLITHNTCTLATGVEGFVRATPIEYMYVNNNLYFLTEGGMKFYGLLQNPNVSICIYEDYTNMSNLKGLQITGQATIVNRESNEYVEIIGYKKINIDNIKNLDINMNIIKVVINKFEFLNFDFKINSLDIKQVLKI